MVSNQGLTLLRSGPRKVIHTRLRLVLAGSPRLDGRQPREGWASAGFRMRSPHKALHKQTVARGSLLHWVSKASRPVRSEVGGVSPTGKSDSFRSCVHACVRASEAVCARERAILQPLGRGNSRCVPALVSSFGYFADRCWGFKEKA